jgi:hypothetical protein
VVASPLELSEALPSLLPQASIPIRPQQERGAWSVHQVFFMDNKTHCKFADSLFPWFFLMHVVQYMVHSYKNHAYYTMEIHGILYSASPYIVYRFVNHTTIRYKWIREIFSPPEKTVCFCLSTKELYTLINEIGCMESDHLQHLQKPDNGVSGAIISLKKITSQSQLMQR